MMKKIPTSVPVFIQDLECQNDRYSTAKLKVFYVGETGDHRLFTRDFSEKLVQSLPSTPVVGFFSEEDDDFIGHNSEQYVYGHVPETATISFEKDEETNQEFLITDVILYTERKDNIGKIAKKIVGKQHSLELDPDTLKYKINRDSQGRFLNIEFLEGTFIGLSVLGDNEKPAFSGSGFFTTDESFKEFAEKCHERFDKFLNVLNKNGGNITVFNKENYFSQVFNSFAARTMQEFIEDIYKTLADMNIYGIVCENTTDYAVIYAYYDDVDACEYRKFEISEENGQLTLSNPVKVTTRFLTEEEIQLLSDNETFNKDEEEPKEEEVENAKSQDEEEENKTDDSVDETDDKNKEEEDFAATPNTEDNNKDEDEDKKDNDEGDSNAAAKSQVENEDDDKTGDNIDDTDDTTDNDNVNDDDDDDDEKQKQAATASVSSSTLSDAEKVELDNYRRNAKIALINTYKNDLSEEILNNYHLSVDNYTKEELEAKLAIEYRNFVKNTDTNKQTEKTVTIFTKVAMPENYDENNVTAVVNKYKNK